MRKNYFVKNLLAASMLLVVSMGMVSCQGLLDAIVGSQDNPSSQPSQPSTQPTETVVTPTAQGAKVEASSPEAVSKALATLVDDIKAKGVGEGKEYKVFAEYMVKGMLNVYRVANISHYPIFFFENERGEITSYKGYNNIYETDEKAYVKNSQDLYAYLSKSSFEASDKVEAKPMDEKQLIKIARIYHEDVCKSNEDCIEYEYNTKSDDDKCTLYVGMGIDKFFRSKDCDAETLAMLEFGVDFDMKRVRKGMSVFVGFDIAQRKKDDSLFNVAFNLKGACQWKMPFDNNKVIYRLGVSSYMLSNFGAYGGIGCDLGNKNLGLVLCAEIYSPSMKMSTFIEDYDDKFGSNSHLNLSISIRF